jgi:hypothetical protein
MCFAELCSRNVLARSSRVKGLSPMLMALFEQRNAQG